MLSKRSLRDETLKNRCRMLCSSWRAQFKTKWLPIEITIVFRWWLLYYLMRIWSNLVVRTSIVCVFLSASGTSCTYWFTTAFKSPHRAICRTPSARSGVRNHGVACALCHRPISSCRRRNVQWWPLPSQHRWLFYITLQTVAAFCLYPSTVCTSNWDIFYTKVLFYIHHRICKQTSCDVITSCAGTSWYDPKNMKCSSRNQSWSMECWINASAIHG